jgi:hypothetical protein
MSTNAWSAIPASTSVRRVQEGDLLPRQFRRPTRHRLRLQRILTALAKLGQPAINSLAVQPQCLSDLLRMDPGPDLLHRTHPQHLKRLMIQFPAVVIAHTQIVPDHTTKVDLLMNSLVSARCARTRTLCRAQEPVVRPGPGPDEWRVDVRQWLSRRRAAGRPRWIARWVRARVNPLRRGRVYVTSPLILASADIAGAGWSAALGSGSWMITIPACAGARRLEPTSSDEPQKGYPKRTSSAV